MRVVYEVATAERVERRYLVEFDTVDIARLNGLPVGQVDDEDCKVYAEELVTSGEDIKFTEGSAVIDEVLMRRGAGMSLNKAQKEWLAHRTGLRRWSGSRPSRAASGRRQRSRWQAGSPSRASA